MLCTEWAIANIAITSIELDKIIRTDVEQKLRTGVGTKLEQAFIKVPFGNPQDFTKMPPDRLVKQLQDVSCVTKYKASFEKRFLKKRNKGILHTIQNAKKTVRKKFTSFRSRVAGSKINQHNEDRSR